MEVKIEYRNDEGQLIKGTITMDDEEFVDFIAIWSDDIEWDD